jgi:hypothetical protein
MFWMVQVPDRALHISGDTASISLVDVPEIDTFTFYDPYPPSGNVPSVTSFTMAYTRSGAPRQVIPTSSDPTSPFNWAGEMWSATGSVTFSVAYHDGTFSASGSGVSSSTDFGEMGTERNGRFVATSR